MTWIDTHSHLDFEVFDADRDQVVNQAIKEGVSKIIIPGVRRETWSNLSALIQRYPVLLGGVGVHPYYLDSYQPSDLDALIDIAQQDWVKAIGECGIDGFLAQNSQAEESDCFSIEHQQAVFEAHIDIANQVQKPLIVHHRKSHHLILQSFKRCKPRFGGVIHAFSGSMNDAKSYLAHGFKLGCGGTITYERAQKTRRVFTELDLQHIVLETDSPDMPLAGYQGQRNEPKQVVAVGQCLAKLKNSEEGKIAEVTTDNVRTLFSLS